MNTIPSDYLDLFARETFAHLASLTPAGVPHVTPVWIDYDRDAGDVLVNTERGRRKERNVRLDPRVGVSMLDPEDPYRRLSLTGVVHTVTTEGARDHIDALSQRYLGRPFSKRGGPERVVLRIEPRATF